MPLQIQTDAPSTNGMYVAYIDPRIPVAFAGKTLLMYIDGVWGYVGSGENYRGPVYGWIGPLPALRIEE